MYVKTMLKELITRLKAMQLISVIYHRYIGYWSPCKISVSNISTEIISDIDRYITDFHDMSTFLLSSTIRLSSYCCYYSYLLQLLAFCKLQKANLLMVGEYTELLVLNCYIYKFYMILKVPISHRDNLYLKYRSLTDILFFTALTA
ncbi:hypothetical protein Hanom_Chr12g01131631 [Helianthus anomalus]